jgi:transposase
MDHIAIDLGTRESQVCVRSEQGEIVEERRIATRPEKLRRFLEGRSKSRVIVETGAEAFWVAEIALECGHDARVVPSMLAPSLGVGRRGQKSDQRDARVLSETSCRLEMPTVHIPTVETRRLQSRLGMRQALVRSRTKLINVTRAYLRTIGERAPIRSAEKLIVTLREKLADVAPHLEPLLQAIEALNRSIDQFDEELEKQAGNNELAQRLQTVPGVGVVTSLWFIATLDVASRFRNGAAVGSYVGLVPSEHSSGVKQRKGAITKAGSPSMRGVLVQASWAALRSRRHHNDPMVCWARGIAKRRGKKIAVVALARKLSGILFAIWRDGSRYDAVRGAAASGELPAPPRRRAPSNGPRRPRPLRLEPATV